VPRRSSIAPSPCNAVIRREIGRGANNDAAGGDGNADDPWFGQVAHDARRSRGRSVAIQSSQYSFVPPRRRRQLAADIARSQRIKPGNNPHLPHDSPYQARCWRSTAVARPQLQAAWCRRSRERRAFHRLRRCLGLDEIVPRLDYPLTRTVRPSWHRSSTAHTRAGSVTAKEQRFRSLSPNGLGR